MSCKSDVVWTQCVLSFLQVCFYVSSFISENIFIVQWDKMQIANKTEKGNFTFQLQLHKNNDIVFAYKEVRYRPLLDLKLHFQLAHQL